MQPQRSHEIPEDIDILVVGGGTAGGALAGILARDTDATVVLLEAGPDYGPFASGRWPAELLDARKLGLTHDWGYSGLCHPTHGQSSPFERARVIGGCSAHNGCVALSGHRCDYDHWVELGNPGWDWESIAPAFDRAREALRVRPVDESEITPFQRTFVDGAVAAGVPRVADLDDPDAVSGVAAPPVNIADGVRWNSALAYLDPVRERPNLTIIGDALVDRVELHSARAVAAEVLIDGRRLRVPAQRIVLASGAYGSPAILWRSGIGPAEELQALGIVPRHVLPGVGRSLTDHPAVRVRYSGSERLDRAMTERATAGWCPDEQTLAKARSRRCQEAFDLHLYAVSEIDPSTGEWRYDVWVSCVAPHSQGRVMLTSADPAVAPAIDHGFLTDPVGHDLDVLVDGVRLAREAMADSLAAGLLTGERQPGPTVSSREDLAEFVRGAVGIYYHPGCSCRMGPASDPLAVVDHTGQVHALEGLYVCDASIFPTLMRANTNLPAAMLAERLAPVIGAM